MAFFYASALLGGQLVYADEGTLAESMEEAPVSAEILNTEAAKEFYSTVEEVEDQGAYSPPEILAEPSSDSVEIESLHPTADLRVTTILRNLRTGNVYRLSERLPETHQFWLMPENEKAELFKRKSDILRSVLHMSSIFLERPSSLVIAYDPRRASLEKYYEIRQLINEEVSEEDQVMLETAANDKGFRKKFTEYFLSMAYKRMLRRPRFHATKDFSGFHFSIGLGAGIVNGESGYQWLVDKVNNKTGWNLKAPEFLKKNIKLGKVKSLGFKILVNHRTKKIMWKSYKEVNRPIEAKFFTPFLGIVIKTGFTQISSQERDESEYTNGRDEFLLIFHRTETPNAQSIGFNGILGFPMTPLDSLLIFSNDAVKTVRKRTLYDFDKVLRPFRKPKSQWCRQLF